MIEPIVRAFDALLSDFSWRRVTALLVFTLYIAMFFAVSELFTGHFRLARVEHAAKILSRLQEIEAKSLPSDSPLARVHRNLTVTLEQLTAASPGPPATLVPLWKFLAAVAPWLAMGLFFLRDLSRGKPGAGLTIIGVVSLGLLAALFAMVVPTFLWPWGNLVIYPFFVFVSFSVFSVIRTRKKIANGA